MGQLFFIFQVAFYCDAGYSINGQKNGFFLDILSSCGYDYKVCKQGRDCHEQSDYGQAGRAMQITRHYLSRLRDLRRPGECLGLRWEDIDTKKNMLNIRRTLNRLPKVDYNGIGNSTEVVIQEPKTKKDLNYNKNSTRSC